MFILADIVPPFDMVVFRNMLLIRRFFGHKFMFAQICRPLGGKSSSSIFQKASMQDRQFFHCMACSDAMGMLPNVGHAHPDYSVRQIRKDIRRFPARYPVRWCFPTKSDNTVRPRRLAAHTTPRFSRGMYRITVHNTATAIQDRRRRRCTGPTWRRVVSFDVLLRRLYSLFVPYPALYFLLAPLRLHVPGNRAGLGHF